MTPEIRYKDWFNEQFRCHLFHSVSYRWDTQRSLFSNLHRDVLTPNRLWVVALFMKSHLAVYEEMGNPHFLNVLGCRSTFRGQTFHRLVEERASRHAECKKSTP